MKNVLKTLALCLPILIYSCTKEQNDCDPNDRESSCYGGTGGPDEWLLVEFKRDGETEIRFEYDGENRIKKRFIHANDGSLHTETFTYDALNRMTGSIAETGGKTYQIEKYFYSGEDIRPVRGHHHTPGTDHEVNIQYIYTGLSVTETAVSTDGDVIAVFTYDFDSKGNIIRSVIGEAIFEYGDYDDKAHAWTNYPWAWKARSENNPRSIKLTAGAASYDQIWEYTYNSDGYPTDAKVFDRETNILLQTNTYLYKRVE